MPISYPPCVPMAGYTMLAIKLSAKLSLTPYLNT